MVEFLIKNGANVHVTDKKKRTALMLALMYESAATVKLLLEQGIDVFAQDIYGWTAGDYALPVNCHLISEYKEEKQHKGPSLNGNPVCESSEEDSLSRFSNRPGADDSWLISEKVLDSDTESISESLPQKYADHLPGAAGQIGKNRVNGEIEGKNCIL
uniref:Uncharacterized protein n=1 Tax=Sus scrofa TaxID=9823 RepID=A0A8D2C764_PIG